MQWYGQKRIYASTQWHARRHHNSDNFCRMFSPDTSSVCDNLTLRDRFTVQNVKKKRMWILLVQLFTWNGNLSSETVDPFTKVLGRTQALVSDNDCSQKQIQMKLMFALYTKLKSVVRTQRTWCKWSECNVLGAILFRSVQFNLFI